MDKNIIILAESYEQGSEHYIDNYCDDNRKLRYDNVDIFITTTIAEIPTVVIHGVEVLERVDPMLVLYVKDLVVPYEFMGVIKERRKQLEINDYNKIHDSFWVHEELAKAAVCYATPNDLRKFKTSREVTCPVNWPWSPRYWKPSPKDRIKELEKSAALLAAEIARLQNEN